MTLAISAVVVRWKTHKAFVLCFVAAALVLLGACTEKAKTIQLGANQFEAESVAAIEKIDELRIKETQAESLPPEEATAKFVRQVKKSTKPISLKSLDTMLNPYKLKPLKGEKAWRDFIMKMRQQYTTFAKTFASLDKGSLFAAPEVKKAVPLIDKLIAQMALFAHSIKDKPAKFIRERADVAQKLESVRDDGGLNAAQKEAKLRNLETRLRKIVTAEELVSKEALAQCLKAVQVGMELRTLLKNYDNVTLADITEGLSFAFAFASELSGEDFSSLKGKTDAVLAQVDGDPDLKALFNAGLGKINAARTQ